MSCPKSRLEVPARRRASPGSRPSGRPSSERAATRPEGSYTSRLLAGGVDAVARKVAEEATEVVLAAKDDAAAEAAGLARPREALAGELADLLYHALVLCAERGLPPSEVIAVLEARHSEPGGDVPGSGLRAAAHDPALAAQGDPPVAAGDECRRGCRSVDEALAVDREATLADEAPRLAARPGAGRDGHVEDRPAVRRRPDLEAAERLVQ